MTLGMRVSMGTLQWRTSAALGQFGLPEVFAKAIASWDVEVSKGERFDEGR